jgi:hypothetical protein
MIGADGKFKPGAGHPLLIDKRLAVRTMEGWCGSQTHEMKLMGKVSRQCICQT